MMKKICMIILALSGVFLVGCASLQLAKDGETSYEIVKPSQSKEVDDYAMKVLGNYLKQKTGAEFTVVSPEKISADKKHIFVGISEPSLKTLGKNSLDGLKDQGHVVRSDGEDIFLYGKGIHGNFSAVMLFMEEELGRQWFDLNQTPPCIKQKDLKLKTFSHKRSFSFPYRWLPGDNDWSYQNGKNVDYHFGKRHTPGFVPDLYMDLPMFAAQTSFTYIPPTTEHGAVLGHFPWMKNENYFKTNPEFFSLNQPSGQRVAKQLCFSNPELRQEFTKNLLLHLDAIMADQSIPEELRRRTVLSIGDTDDNSLKRLCHCPNCLALEKAYQSNGGPRFDYVIEFAGILKKRQPEARIKFIAYRIPHTVIPPVLPAGKAFPDNVIVQFAAVEDKHNYPWADHRNNNGVFAEYLKKWSALVKNVWVWYYPSYYGIGSMLPYVSINRVAADMKLMKQVGVECIYYEDFNPQRYLSAGFAPLVILRVPPACTGCRLRY